MLQTKKEMQAIDSALASTYNVLKPGDVVSLMWHDRQRDRFYPNKQKIDLIKDIENFNLDNYEGYVKVHYTIVDSVHTTKDNFYNTKVLKND